MKISIQQIKTAKPRAISWLRKLPGSREPSLSRPLTDRSALAAVIKMRLEREASRASRRSTRERCSVAVVQAITWIDGSGHQRQRGGARERRT